MRPYEPPKLKLRGDDPGDSVQTIEALAAEVNATVEYRSWVQDVEGRWHWSNYAAPVGSGTWSVELYDDQVKVQARLVSEWQDIDRSTIPRGVARFPGALT